MVVRSAARIKGLYEQFYWIWPSIKLGQQLLFVEFVLPVVKWNLSLITTFIDKHWIVFEENSTDHVLLYLEFY
jgi:hypothetical protein